MSEIATDENGAGGWLVWPSTAGTACATAADTAGCPPATGFAQHAKDRLPLLPLQNIQNIQNMRTPHASHSCSPWPDFADSAVCAASGVSDTAPATDAGAAPSSLASDAAMPSLDASTAAPASAPASASDRQLADRLPTATPATPWQRVQPCNSRIHIDSPLRVLLNRELLPIWSSSTRLRAVSLRPYARTFVSSERDLRYIGQEADPASPPYALAYSWRLQQQLLAAVLESGSVCIFQTDGELGRPVLQWAAHDNAIFDCAWTNDNTQIITGAGDSCVRLWDVETQRCLVEYRDHSGSIKSISCSPFQPDIFCTGSRDGRMAIWDRRVSSEWRLPHASPADRESRPAIRIPDAHLHVVQGGLRVPSTTKSRSRTPKPPQTATPAKHTASVTAVKFLTHKSDMVASVGSADGLVKFWDLRAVGGAGSLNADVERSTPSKFRRRPFGFSSLSLNSAGTKLYASCLDDSIHEFNTHGLGAAVNRFSHPTFRCSSFYIRTAISPDDSMLISGSSSTSVFLWDLHRPQSTPFLLKGHQSETTGLATCSDDMSVRVWRAGVDLDSLPDDPGVKHLRAAVH
ncbi:WD40-repeat-containing domain protein, partial [Entophlyctis helioformis]